MMQLRFLPILLVCILGGSQAEEVSLQAALNFKLTSYYLYYLRICQVGNFYPVQVSVYYSVMCENCRAFFTAKFEPYFEDFKQWIDLDFIPFGNSTVSECAKNCEIKIISQSV
jgi:Gamma interferon inducible lysosomal thiol reductase (GILT)